MSAVISVEDLRYRYPSSDRDAVASMSFDVQAGEVFGFLGPSGAGKTTTQSILIGLLEGWAGSVQVLGRDRAAWGLEFFDRIGVSFELPVGYPRLTVVEDLHHFGNLHRVPVLEDPRRLLASVGLAEAADQEIRSLSKGMRTRLNLARSLIHRPDLLFLDEPTSGLDPVNVAAVRDIIRSQKSEGRTIFLTTHDMATAAAVCDRVAFVVDGRIAAIGDPRELEMAHGRRTLTVDYRRGDLIEHRSFPLGSIDQDLLALLSSDSVLSIRTDDATLDEVFVAVTGSPL